MRDPNFKSFVVQRMWTAPNIKKGGMAFLEVDMNQFEDRVLLWIIENEQEKREKKEGLYRHLERSVILTAVLLRCSDGSGTQRPSPHAWFWPFYPLN